MFELLNILEMEKTRSILKTTHEVMYKVVITALNSLKIHWEDPQEIPILFKREFIDKGRIDLAYWRIWSRVEELKKCWMRGS